MFGNTRVLSSIADIKRNHPGEWIALAVVETDDDGFALAGEVIVHDRDERVIWTALKLGRAEEPVYVFYTGLPGESQAAA